MEKEQEKENTLSRIRKAGMAEFLQKGFKDASLRNIAADAGVTTGAFYGYFSGKEALFADLVEKHAATVMGWFTATQEAFSALPDEEQPVQMSNASVDCIDRIIDYAYDHYDSFKLLICCADGTAYDHFVHNMVEIEVESTLRFIGVLRRSGHPVPPLDADFCHLVCSGMFGGMFETIVHDMPKDKAKAYVQQLQQFYAAGWRKLMGI